ncbi:uncharacterized protein AMSG_04305 [Thecamonas trahens ATCC 50062]|uniref:Uncharacterized protein n=1 Tax=Thecamonas trahens ATCC 50062 TaxID=461836 RepID=A0A0L0D7B8_THETB|nr:hypothetical protein AMSG_04305 [Thecamonas trahens ATCC 50062]KNC48075.1 hypothetical protein AMSG_04305 [Thecamonas trahens ATCC 50062]|eukprot:XP_013759090.1 hypothetical protein AMSG_04305 [Thecamonas trahens ATCC 50062]
MGGAATQADSFAVPLSRDAGSLAALDITGGGWVGDLDSDSIPDVVTIESDGIRVAHGMLTGATPVLVNTIIGDHQNSFEKKRVFANKHQTVRFFDLDTDGIKDMFWSSWATSTHSGYNHHLTWYRGLGDGVFDETRNTVYSFTSQCGYIRDVAVADFNNDGFNDLAWFTSSECVFYRHAAAPGVFDATYPSVEITNDLADHSDCRFINIVDYNMDSMLDIILTCSHGTMPLFPNVAANNTQLYAPGPVADTLIGREDIWSVEFQDVDRDGDIDIVFAEYDPDVVAYRRNEGDGSYTDFNYDVENPWRVTVGDINNDTYLDACGTALYNRIFCFLFDESSNQFSIASLFDAPGATNATSIKIIDMDGDGLPDIVGLDNMQNYDWKFDIQRSIHYYRNQLYELPGRIFDLNRPVGHVAGVRGESYVFSIDDFSGDGVGDVATIHLTTNSRSLSLYVTSGPGTGHSLAVATPRYGYQQLVVPLSGIPRASLFGDRDADGDVDILIAVGGSNSRLVFVRSFAAGSGAVPGSGANFSTPTNLGSGLDPSDEPHAMQLVDFAGSSSARDVVVAWQHATTSGYIAVYSVDTWATATQATTTRTVVADGLVLPNTLAVADIDADGSLDIVVNDYYTVYAYRNVNNSLSQLVRTLVASPYPAEEANFFTSMHVVVGHLNPLEDAHVDLVVQANEFYIYNFMGLGPDTSGAPAFTSFRDTPIIRVFERNQGANQAVKGLALVDVDTDGYIDIMFPTTRGVAFLPNLGYPGARKASQLVDRDPLEEMYISASTAADYNRDSHVDFVIYHPASEESGRLRFFFDSPTFEVSYDVWLELGGRVVALESADVNNDGVQDVVFATGYQHNTIGWIPNIGPPLYFRAEDVVIITANTTLDAPDLVGVHRMHGQLLPLANSSDPVYSVFLLAGVAGTVGLLPGNASASGRFDDPYVLAALPDETCNFAHDMAAADMTGDGAPDVLVACYKSDRVMLGVSAPSVAGAPWGMAPFVELQPDRTGDIWTLCAIDLNNDGLVDLVTGAEWVENAAYAVNLGTPLAPLLGPPRILLPQYAEWRDLSPAAEDRPATTVGMAVADFNLDGWSDIIAFPTSRSVVLYLNVGGMYNETEFDDTSSSAGRSRLRIVNRWYDIRNKYASETRANYAQVLDVDGDGYPDWLTSSQWTYTRSAGYAGINSVFRTLRAPARFRVPVETCGYTLTCVVDTMVRHPGTYNLDIVELPQGTYSGCWKDQPHVLSRSVHLLGIGHVVVDCGPGGGTLFASSEPGIVIQLENLTVVRATTTSVQFGGAVLGVTDGTVILRNVTLANCTARQGDDPTVASPTFGFGGAILLRDSASLVAYDSVLASNTADRSGGAVAAVGADVHVELERVVCAWNSAEVSGGCIFVESSGGTSRVVINNSMLTDNSAAGVSPSFTSARVGGVLAVTAIRGDIEIEVSGSVLSRNVVRDGGGALHAHSIKSAEIDVRVKSSELNENEATEGSGGALLLEAIQGSACRLWVGGNAELARNRAAKSGGAIALEAHGVSATVRLDVTGGTSVVDNMAGHHGGGMMLAGQQADGRLDGGAVIVTNAARRLGGALAVVGGGSFTSADAQMRENEASFGGAVAAASESQYLRGVTSANGFPIEPSSSSLEALAMPVGSEPAGCVQRGVVEIRETALVRNRAVYGAVGFACGARVVLAGSGNEPFELDPTKAVEQMLPATGMFFVCHAQAGYCASGSDPCCTAPEVSTSYGSFLRSAPWIDVAPAMEVVVNASLPAVVDAVGYAPLVGGPLVSLAWVSSLPAVISSGTLFGAGAGQVMALDGFGQVVVDPQVMVAMELADLSLESAYAFVGSGRQQPLDAEVLAFSGVGVAARIGADVGVAVELHVQVARSAMSLELAPGARISGSVVVQACLPGSGALVKSGSTVLECALCTEGTVSAETSLEPCEICPESTVLTGIGATECLTCPVNAQVEQGFVPVAGGGLNCTCIPGYFSMLREINEPCIECPEGARCDGGLAMPVALPGYFPTNEPGVFLECPNARACRGGYPFACAKGYTGRLCGACARRYYALSGECYKCDNRTLPLLGLVMLLSVLVVGVLVWLNAKEELSYKFAAAMIGFNSLQISAMYGQFELPWSNFAAQFFNVVSFFNLNFDLSSPECATVTDDVWLLKWWITVLLPLLFLFPFAAVYCGFLAYKAHLAPRMGRDVKLTVGALRDACRRAYLQLMVLLYLPLAAMAMSYLQCRRDKDGRWVLEAAPAKSCYGTWYWNYFGMAVLFSAIYCVGLPLGVFALLTRLKRVSNPDLFSLRYAFLVGRFSPANYRFEVWIMARKAAVVLAMTFFRAPLTKASVALFALVMSFMQLARYLPYETMFHNQLALLCLGSCMVILWSGTFAEASFRNGTAMAAIIVNVLAIVVGNIIDLILIARRNKKLEAEFDAVFGEGESFGGSQIFDMELDNLGTLDQATVGTSPFVVLDGGSAGSSDLPDAQLSSFVVSSKDLPPPPPPLVSASPMTSMCDAFDSAAFVTTLHSPEAQAKPRLSSLEHDTTLVALSSTPAPPPMPTDQELFVSVMQVQPNKRLGSSSSSSSGSSSSSSPSSRSSS